MMNILIAVHGFPPTHSAGAERRAERMARWLAANGHRVTVFAVERLDEPGFRVEALEQDGFTVHRLYYDVKEGDFYRNLYDYPRAGQAFAALLAANSFDLVHVISGYLLGGQVIHTARKAGLPVIITLTEYWFMCARLNLIQPNGGLCSGPESDEKCMRCLMEDKRRYRLPAQASPLLMDAFWSIAQRLPFANGMTEMVSERRTTLRDALNAANLVICPSQYLISKFAEFGFDTTRYIFMRQGLNTPTGEKPARTTTEAGRTRLGYVGQIKPHKGVDLLVDAAINLLQTGHDISLEIWGTESEAPEYVTLLKERTAAYPTIRWKGRYLGSAVWTVLSNLDVLVVPSRWYENSPNAILEAYEMRLPVVATNLGGMSELVEHEKTGLVFTLNDAADLLAQLKRLITEPDLLERLRAAIPSVKTIDQEMRELVEAYHQLAATQQP
ncbi:MAG: glycosyltransferase [Anaerolineae bacterium]|nr:glycosyltransferase [Anaerolineae bacterium]